MMNNVMVHKGKFTTDTVVGVALLLFKDPSISISSVYKGSNLIKYPFSHKTLEKDNLLYGKSTAELIWILVEPSIDGSLDRKSMLDFVKEVSGYTLNRSVNAIFIEVFRNIERCNTVDWYSENQEQMFISLVHIVHNMLIRLGKSDLKAYTKNVLKLEEIAEQEEVYTTQVFKDREANIIVKDDIIVSKFFPSWRKISKKHNKIIVMLGDKPNEYKFMSGSKDKAIVAITNQKYLHPNGFIAVAEYTPNSVGLKIATADGNILKLPWRTAIIKHFKEL